MVVWIRFVVVVAAAAAVAVAVLIVVIRWVTEVLDSLEPRLSFVQTTVVVAVLLWVLFIVTIYRSIFLTLPHRTAKQQN